MQAVCPITDKRIDQRVARLNGFVVFLLVGSFLLFNFWAALMLLSIDFILRGFVDGKYSLIARFSTFVASKLPWPPKTQNAGPKIFAAQVGTFLSVVSLLLYAKGCGAPCLIIAGVLGFFSFLEGAFGYCVACKLYPLIRRVK